MKVIAILSTAATFAIAAVACGGTSSSEQPVGGERGACYPNGTCNAGLTCLSNSCVVVPGDDGGSADGGSTDGTMDSATHTDGGDASTCTGTDVVCANICVASNPAHCGSSCTKCTPPTNATATCTSGSCGYTCNILRCLSECVDPGNDPLNCGGCGVACGGGVSCVGGFCQPISVAVSPFPAELRVDSTHLYWIQQGGVNGQPGIYRVALLGGSPVQLLATAGASFLAKDSVNLHWTDSAAGTVNKMPLAGGTVTPLALGLNNPGPIAIDATYAYFVITNLNQVSKVPLAGGSVAPVVTLTQFLQGIVVDATNVYVPHYDGSTMVTIEKVPIGGGAATQIGSGPGYTGGIAIDANNVYFTLQQAGPVMRSPIAGGATVQVAAGNGAGITSDGTSIYWADNQSGKVKNAPIAGGTTTTLAAGQVLPTSVAVDATYVYWGNRDGTTGGIFKSVK